MKKLSCWRCFWLDARSLEGSYIWKDFDTVNEVFFQFEEQTQHDSGQKYKVCDTQVMEGSSTFCGPPLYHGQHESRLLNQGLEGIGREKE